MLYLSDIFDIVQSTSFDEGSFQAYLTSGNLTVARAKNIESTNHSVAELAKEFQKALHDFDAAWQLSSGLSMEALWNVFRPTVAENLQQLAACLRVEELADRFDALRWTSGASYQEIRILGQSLADIYDTIEPREMRFNEQLKVNHSIHKSQDPAHRYRIYSILCLNFRSRQVAIQFIKIPIFMTSSKVYASIIVLPLQNLP